MMDRPVEALQQSFLRTKATDLAAFMQVAQLQGQQLEQYDLRRRQGRDRLPPSAIRSAPRRSLRLHQAGRRQRPGDRLGFAAPPQPSCPTSSVRPTAGCRTPTPGRTAPQGRSARTRHISRNIWTSTERISVGSTRVKLLTGSRGWTLERLQAAAFDSYQPGFAQLIPRSSPRLTHCPRAIRAARGWRGRSGFFAPGIPAGAPARSRNRSPSFGASAQGALERAAK